MGINVRTVTVIALLVALRFAASAQAKTERSFFIVEDCPPIANWSELRLNFDAGMKEAARLTPELKERVSKSEVQQHIQGKLDEAISSCETYLADARTELRKKISRPNAIVIGRSSILYASDQTPAVTQTDAERFELQVPKGKIGTVRLADLFGIVGDKPSGDYEELGKENLERWARFDQLVDFFSLCNTYERKQKFAAIFAAVQRVAEKRHLLLVVDEAMLPRGFPTVDISVPVLQHLGHIASRAAE